MLSFRAHERVQNISLWVFVAQLGLLVGIEAVIIAVLGADHSFNVAYNYPTLQQIGIATSLYPICAALGALSVLYLSFALRNVMLMGASLVLWVTGYLLGALVVGNMAALMVSRVIKGLAIGALTSVLPLYIQRVAKSPKQAAQLFTLLQASIPCGILLMALVGKLDNNNVYFKRWMYAAIPTFPILLLAFSLPSEPDVINQKREQEFQHKTSAWLKLRQSMAQLKPSKGDSLLRCLAACLAQAAGPTTAINVIFYYSSTMCQMLGFQAEEADYMAIGLYACNALGTLLSLLFINRLPRLGTLQWSMMGMAIIHFILFMVQLLTSFFPSCSVLGLVAITLIFGFVFLFSALFAGVQLVYTSEVVSKRARSVSIGIATATGWLWNFVIAYASAYLLPVMGCYIFLLFGYLCCLVFVLFALMPQ